MSAFTIYLFLSNIMEQILWFIKLLCTYLVKQNSLGASTAAGARSHPQRRGAHAARVLPAGGQQHPEELHQPPRCRIHGQQRPWDSFAAHQGQAGGQAAARWIRGLQRQP